MQVETYADDRAGGRVFSGVASMRLAVRENSKEPAISLHLICANHNTVGMLTLTKNELLELIAAGTAAIDYINDKEAAHA
jgi:hypothetical protein